MKSLVHIIPILLSVLVLSGRIDARIINVPNDFETIQAGIDEAEEGDTVLVQPGEYVETIVFPGTDIIVGSHFIIEEDEDFITETIIDGDQNGSVVTFSDLGDAVPQLIGFTVRNGGIHGNGGGIYCRHANPILTNLVITENQALNGGGLYFDYSQATLNNTRIVGNSAALGGGLLLFHHPDISMQNVIIEGNEAENTGGGLLIWESNPVLTDVIIRDNIAGTFGGGMRFDHANPILTRVAILNNVGSYGGGIETNWDSNPVLINLTIVGNEADRDWGGGIDCGDSDVTMVNCIVWNNEPLNIRNAGNIEATYSDFENGFEGEATLAMIHCSLILMKETTT